MIPILHRPVYDLINDNIEYGNGIPLVDAIDCKVSERLNGEFTLSLTYPIGGSYWEELVPEKIIIAKPNELDSTPTQPFIITSITRQSGSVAVEAQHISYILRGLLANPTSSPLQTLVSVRNYLNSSVNKNPFTFFSDNTPILPLAESLSWDIPRSVYDIIYGGSNSMLKAFNGLFEIAFNRLNVSFQNARGTEKPLVIKYGINMLSFAQSIEAPDQIQNVYPYAILEKNANDKTKTYIDLRHWSASPETVVEGSSYIGRQAAADISELLIEANYQYYDNVAAISRTGALALFSSLAEKWAAKNQTSATPSALSVSYIDLARTQEYSMLESVPIGIGDIVTVQYPMWGVNEQKEITAATYDVLRERNDNITIGEPNQTVIEKIAAKLREVKR